MAQRLVSKAQFARHCERSKAAITKATAKGPLKAATVDGQIDASHPAAVAYMAACGKEPPPAAPPTTSKKKAPAATPTPTRAAPERRRRPPAPTGPGREPPPIPRLADIVEVLVQIDGYAGLTVEDIARYWGTFGRFAEVLDALKTIAETRRIELANHEKRGSVISRDLVRTHVIGAIDSVQKRLLSDTPRTIASRVFGMCRAGETVEQAEKVVRELISSQLQPVKATAVRVLRSRAAPVPSAGDAASPTG